MPKLETVGDRIFAIAQAKGLPSGKALAALLGVSYEALRSWRAGHSTPNRSRVDVVAKVLGVTPAEFMHAGGALISDPFAREVAERLAALHGRNPAVFRRAYMELSEVLNAMEARLDAPAVVAAAPPAAATPSSPPVAAAKPARVRGR